MSLHYCSQCRRNFRSAIAYFDHCKAKGHKLPPKPKPKREDDESIASLMIEASWNNDPEFDWVREMMS